MTCYFHRIQSPLAKLYTTSTMEHHHFNQCIMILHSNVSLKESSLMMFHLILAFIIYLILEGE